MFGLLFAKSVINKLINFGPLEASLVDGFLALLQSEVAPVAFKHLQEDFALPLSLLILVCIIPLCIERADSDSALPNRLRQSIEQ